MWLHDANVDYLNGKHALFLVAVVVFLFLFLPYTLLLLFGQWLQAISYPKLFSWVKRARLKPFMDLYHAPYKGKHRYWPGLLLVLRFVLLLVFALSSQQDSSINLLAILVRTGMLQLWSWVNGGVVPRCTGRVIHAEHDHLSCSHLPCQSIKRKSVCSWVHICYNSFCNIHWHPCLPHLPANEAHQPL